MVFQVKPTPVWFSTNSLYTPMTNTPLCATRGADGSSRELLCQMINLHCLYYYRLLDAWNRGRVLAQSQNQARRWMEMPGNLFPPQTFAREIEESFSRIPSTGGDTSLSVIVHDKEWIERQGMGGVLGVAQGSHQAPYFVEINYVVSDPFWIDIGRLVRPPARDRGFN